MRYLLMDYGNRGGTIYKSIRSQFFKIAVLKNSLYSQENNCVGVSF